MTTIAEARSALVGATNVLVSRRRVTTNAQEKQDIDGAIEDINIKIGFLDQAGLLQAAVAVSEAANALQAIVASARLGPFDSTVEALAGVAQKLSVLQGQIRQVEALPQAVAPSTQPAPTTAAAPAAAPAGTFKPSGSTNFVNLRQEYQSFFDACTPRLEFRGQIAFYVNHLTKFRSRYEAVGQRLGIPWQFIGIIHGLECSFNFSTHLHNGDPLTARTVHVPSGMPKTGNPPFKWEDSAQDALIHEGFGGQADWSVPQMLFRWETYNGMGYRPVAIPSPYLWSFSNIYTMGKYVADGRLDSNAVSKQCGAAVMLKALG